MRNKSLAALTETAILIAAATALSFFEGDFAWLQGGSVSLVMIPLMVLAFRRGVGWGVGGGFVFGIIKCVIGGGFAWGWASVLLDYSVAYAAVGLCGLFRARGWQYTVGMLTGAFARLAVHFASGVILWAEYIPDEFFGLTMTSPALYSILYNGSYMLISTAITMALMYLLKKPLDKTLNEPRDAA